MKKLKFLTMLAILLPVLALALGGCSSSGSSSGIPVNGTVAFPATAAKIAAKTVGATAGPILTITDLYGNVKVTPTLQPRGGFSIHLPNNRYA